MVFHEVGGAYQGQEKKPAGEGERQIYLIIFKKK